MAEFLPTGLLLQVAQAIADLPPCQYHHRLTRDQIVIALAEHDILPDVIRADMIVDAVEQAEAALIAEETISQLLTRSVEPWEH